MTKKKIADLNDPALYINRELSWLEFNQRVLAEGLSPDVPLLERLKFLAIVSSNLDEFFMIRVAGLRRQRDANPRRKDPSGLTPARQLDLIAKRVHRMVDEQNAGIRRAFDDLSAHGLRLFAPAEWAIEQREFLRAHFDAEIMPVLTPLALKELSPSPLLPGLQLNVAAIVADPGEDGGERIVAIPVPRRLPRFITIPAEEGVQLAQMEHVIAANLDRLFPGCRPLATAVFRVTRDGDVPIDDREADNLLSTVEDAVLARGRRTAVRLTISANSDPRIRDWLTEWLELQKDEVYEIDGILDAAALMEIANRPGFDSLRNPDWPPQPPQDLIGKDDLWQALRDHDVMLFHPYESFDPVVRLVEEAAEDPNVLAIKQTLYRTSDNSPIVRALERAAAAGKQVSVLVELKARFDEARNVNWARRLEDLGCHVIYGVTGLKTHAKALLIVRRETSRLQRYVHLSTGNYNDRTARLYADIGLMSSDRDLATDVSALFNLLTGYSDPVGFSKLTIAPTELRQRLLELIDREIETSTSTRRGLIMAKLNSLEDRAVCEGLYRASRAGVEVKLNVRGICCLRPGVKGVSENIEVHSVVDRFLEHARVFFFRNGGHQEIYLSSADWMVRNLDRRLELLFPVKSPNHRRRLVDMMNTFFDDNIKSHRLLSNGTWKRVAGGDGRVRAQERLYVEAVEAARSAQCAMVRFRPLTKPEE